jgi:hypothetical protein
VRSRRIRGIVLLLIAASPLVAAAPVSLDRLFPREAEITADRPGLVRLPLPPAVLTTTRPDLSDLRVFDARGREVPYWVDGRRGADEAVEAGETFASRVLTLTREVEMREPGPDIHREHYRIAAPPGAPEAGAWTLVFEVGAARFARSVRVRAGDDSLLEEQAIFRLDPETLRVRLPLPAFHADALDVDITGEEGFYLEPRFRFEASRVFDPLAESAVALEELSRESGEGRTVVLLARPSGIVPDRLRLASDTGPFQRAIAVFDELPGRADRRIASGRVFRVNALRGVQQLELDLQPASGSVLRLEIDDGDAPPLEMLTVSAVMRQPALVFDLPGSEGEAARGLLRFGGGRAHRPRYQLQSLLPSAGETLRGSEAEAAARLYDPSQLGLARLGPSRPNPAFDASPALAFAMHPGAEIDGRAYSHRRVLHIDPSPEGLSRLVLAPEDVAHSEGGLADLRVVDDDARQWPYLMQPEAVERALPLVLESRETRRKVSRYALGLPISPLTARGITLRSGAPFFDRAFRLDALDGEGERREVARGRITKDARRPRPVEIGFAPQPTHGFVLEVEDGDDAPLGIDGVEVRTRLPQLFLVAPPGRYWLLVGQPDASAPHYELERVRDVVLAVSSHSVATEALEPNPDFSLAARLRSEDGPAGWIQRGLIWGVLGLAVVVLIALTLRVVRSEAPPPAGGGGAPS